jgi:hypothetical protein
MGQRLFETISSVGHRLVLLQEPVEIHTLVSLLGLLGVAQQTQFNSLRVVVDQTVGTLNCTSIGLVELADEDT